MSRIESLAGTVSKLFGNGRTDPSGEEIADAHYGSRRKVWAVRNQLIPVRDYMRDVANPPHSMIHLVSETYYDEFRLSLPTNRTDARRCLPIGRGKQSWGLRIPIDIDDRIWLASIGQNYATAVGKGGVNLERLAIAMDQGMISQQAFRGIIQDAVDRGQVSINEVKAIIGKHGLRISPPSI